MLAENEVITDVQVIDRGKCHHCKGDDTHYSVLVRDDARTVERRYCSECTVALLQFENAREPMCALSVVKEVEYHKVHCA